MTAPCDDPEKWRELLAAAALPDAAVQVLTSQGFTTPAGFAFAFSEAALFEEFLGHAFGALGLREALGLGEAVWKWSPTAAALRRLWHDCKGMAVAPVPSPCTVPSGPVAPQLAGLEWAECLPPKLTQECMKKMMDAYKKSFPSEVLDKDSLPGLRYWSRVHQMVQPGAALVWVPWTQILSRRQEDDILEARSVKAPRSDAVALLQLAWDQPPSLHEAEVQKSTFNILRMFEVRRNTLALCGAAHVGVVRALDNKLLAAFTATYPGDISLRGPTAKEFMAADRHIWEEIARLVNEEDWVFDDAVHELTANRPDISQWMQPRPKPPPAQSRAASSGKGGHKSKQPPAPLPRPGAKKGKGRSKGQQKRSRSPRRGGQTGMCNRWNTTGCGGGANCKYVHGCSFVLPSGKPCGANHRISEHPR